MGNDLARVYCAATDGGLLDKEQRMIEAQLDAVLDEIETLFAIADDDTIERANTLLNVDLVRLSSTKYKNEHTRGRLVTMAAKLGADQFPGSESWHPTNPHLWQLIVQGKGTDEK